MQKETTRVAMVTGPTSGIGREVARGLAVAGFEVILACRDPRKGAEVREDIARTTGNERPVVEEVDLSSLASIRSLGGRLAASHPRIQVLVNNAAIYRRTRRTTVDGIEAQFAVNVLAPFLLMRLLLPSLRAGAPSRIVNVSSEAHRGPRLRFEDLQGTRDYSGFRAYNASKLALNLLTFEAARRLEGSGVTANAVHPGVIRTNLGRGEFPAAFSAFRPFFGSPTEGARTPLYVATSPDLEGVTGTYFVKMRPKRASEASYDAAAARRLWDLCQDLVQRQSAD